MCVCVCVCVCVCSSYGYDSVRKRDEMGYSRHAFIYLSVPPHSSPFPYFSMLSLSLALPPLPSLPCPPSLALPPSLHLSTTSTHLLSDLWVDGEDRNKGL